MKPRAEVMACLCGSGATGAAAALDVDAVTQGQKLLERKEVRALLARFQKIAPGGWMDAEVFCNGMGLMGLGDGKYLARRMFAAFDSDADGRVGPQEFVESLGVMLRGNPEEKLRLSFRLANASGGEELSYHDFRELLLAITELRHAIMGADHASRTPTEDEVQEVFQVFLAPGRQGLGLAEYIQLAQNSEFFRTTIGVEVSGEVPATAQPSGLLGPRTSGIRPPPLKDLGELKPGFVPLYGADAHRSNSPSGKFTSPAPAKVAAPSDVKIQISPPPPNRPGQFGARAPPALSRDALETPHKQSSKESPHGHRHSPSGVSRPMSPGASGRRGSFTRLFGPVAADLAALDAGGALSGRSQGPGGTQRDLAELLALCRSIEASLERDASERPENGASPDSDSDDGEKGWWVAPKTPRREPAALLRAVTSLRLKVQELADSMGLSAQDELGLDAYELLVRQQVGLSDRHVQANIGRERQRDARGKLDRKKDQQQKGNLPDFMAKSAVVGLATAATTRLEKRQAGPKRILGPKRGIAVHFGHENWNMVISMMIGIRMSVARVCGEFDRTPEEQDFASKEKLNILPKFVNIFDSQLSRHVSCNRFVDYAPVIFHNIRTHFGVSSADYLRALGPEQLVGNMVLGDLTSLAEQSSEGKSGAFFYYSTGGGFVIKTITKQEKKLMMGMMKPYYEYVMDPENRGSLFTKYYGVHSLQVRRTQAGRTQGTKIYFVVMANMFATPHQMHRRYDLKGSWVLRETAPEMGMAVARKDNNFTDDHEVINLGARRDAMIKQIARDANFLASHNLLDYSLLVGIHEIGHGAHLQDPLAQPADAEDYGGLLSSCGTKIFYVSIIDYLTAFTWKKRAENTWKGLYSDKDGISCVPSRQYCDRFVKFMTKHIVE